MKNFENTEGGNGQKEIAMQYLKQHEESTSLLRRINLIGDNLQKMRNDNLENGIFADQYKQLQTDYNELDGELNLARDRMEDLKEKLTDETKNTYLTVKVDREGRKVSYRSDGSQQVT